VLLALRVDKELMIAYCLEHEFGDDVSVSFPRNVCIGTVLGGHTQEAVVDVGPVDPKSIECSEATRLSLVESIQRNLMSCADLQHDAKLLESGWITLADRRGPIYENRAPEASEFFGAVRVEDGLLDPDSFQANPMHRLVSVHGVSVPHPHFLEKWVEESYRCANDGDAKLV
jgi:hypothetical protein